MILLLSGGQDSTALLFHSLSRGIVNIHALTINYGQSHTREVEAACCVVAVAQLYFPKAKITHEVLNLGRNVLVQETGTDITPARNLLFLTIAANRCATVGESVIGIGACFNDATTFADCRPEFIAAARAPISLSLTGYPSGITILAPLIDKTKKEIVDICSEIVGCDEAIALSHTCYLGTDEPCMKCAACIARAAGFKAANKADPLWIRISQSRI